MIPLVASPKELALVRADIDEVAVEVEKENGTAVDFKVGG